MNDLKQAILRAQSLGGHLVMNTNNEIIRVVIDVRGDSVVFENGRTYTPNPVLDTFSYLLPLETFK